MARRYYNVSLLRVELRLTLTVALEQRRQELARVALRTCRDLLRRARDHDGSAAIAALGAHIDQAVGNLDDIKVVLDHQNRVARIDQALQHVEQLANILKMKAGCGLVQNVERLARLAAMKLLGELHALRLAARKRRCRLAQAHVAQDPRHIGSAVCA